MMSPMPYSANMINFYKNLFLKIQKNSRAAFLNHPQVSHKTYAAQKMMISHPES